MSELLTSSGSVSEIPYSPLSMTVLSGLLEQDREASIEELQCKLEVEAAITQPITSFIKNALLKHGLVDGEDNALRTTEAGIDYIDQRTDYVDNPPKKRQRFWPTKYHILGYLQHEAGADGWLFGPDAEPIPALDRLAEELGMPRYVVSRRLSDYEKARLIEKQRSVNSGHREDPKVTDLRLTQHGEAELEEMRIRHPKTIFEITEAVMDDQVVFEKVDPKYLLDNLVMVTDEINNMLIELGEKPKDFTKFEELSKGDMNTALNRFRLVAKKLEKRVDKARTRIHMLSA